MIAAISLGSLPKEEREEDFVEATVEAEADGLSPLFLDAVMVGVLS